MELNDGNLAGAMSTAEIGKIFAEMIRQDKVQIISCTGANLEETS
jgi:deoxyhypusine synthase